MYICNQILWYSNNCKRTARIHNEEPREDYSSNFRKILHCFKDLTISEEQFREMHKELWKLRDSLEEKDLKLEKEAKQKLYLEEKDKEQEIYRLTKNAYLGIK